MLLKYLNDLDRAVQQVRQRPGPEAYGRCVECATVLSNYLHDQVAPLRERGFELMDELLPEELRDVVQDTAVPPINNAPASQLTRAI